MKPAQTNVEVQVVSTFTITPSSPTPPHLRHYPLSFFDQLSPPLFMPMILFFPKDNAISNEDRADVIKQSLAEALALFYPLAGRVKGNTYIDCDDQGALFVEARVNCNLSSIVKNPVPGQLNRLFLPLELDDVKELPLAVQVTFFECGALALSLSMNHKVGEALSLFIFLNSWAAIGRGDPDSVITPVFDSASFFPPMDMSGVKLNTGIVKEGIVTKRFIFDSSMISSLQEKYNEAGSKRPSRVEALSAFLWSRYMASTQTKSDANNASEHAKLYSVLHAVNLRTRMDPPLSEHHFGNISRIAVTTPAADIGDDRCYKIIKEVRNALKQVNPEFVKKLQQSHFLLNQMKERSEKTLKNELISFGFTSLCRFPIYESDFGWGKPIWVGSASLKFRNLTVFLDTKVGDGIEVWVNLNEEDMVKFEKDKELLECLSLTDSES